MSFAILSAMLLAGAAPYNPQETVHVAYDPAALVTESGRKTFTRRVERAVRRVCGGESSVGSHMPSSAMLACRTEARVSAEDQMQRAIARANGQPIKLANRR